MATASGKKETSFNHHILQSECSAPETSHETRTNAHRELPGHRPARRVWDFRHLFLGKKDGKETQRAGGAGGAGFVCSRSRGAMSDRRIWPYPDICRPPVPFRHPRVKGWQVPPRLACEAARISWAALGLLPGLQLTSATELHPAHLEGASPGVGWLLLSWRSM